MRGFVDDHPNAEDVAEKHDHLRSIGGTVREATEEGRKHQGQEDDDGDHGHAQATEREDIKHSSTSETIHLFSP